MKRLLGLLLIISLLLSLAIAAHAEEAAPEEVPTTADAAETEPETTAPETETSSRIIVIASEDELPEGYILDSEFSIPVILSVENGWSYNLTELLQAVADDDYIYYIVEKDIPKGYAAIYSLLETDLTDGNIIIIKNVKEGEPPVYELPETGGTGTELYTVVGAALLLTAAAYGVFLHRKRKAEAE